MAYTLKLSAKERIGLDTLMGMQGGKAAELRIPFQILEKLDVTVGYKERFLKPIPGGVLIWDNEAVELAESLPVEFEMDELHKIQEVIDKWDRFQTADLRWVNSLKAAVRNLIEEAPTKKAVKK